jgi:hypothetical protein
VMLTAATTTMPGLRMGKRRSCSRGERSSTLAAARDMSCRRYVQQHGPSFSATSGSGADGDSDEVWHEEFEDDGGRHWARFARAMELDPDQAIRYSWSGRAVWPQPLAPPPHCPACSAPRVFECQLMPPLLRVLNVDALSVAVYCCSHGCAPEADRDGLALAHEVCHPGLPVSCCWY